MSATPCAVVLAGGRGTRLQRVLPDLPKPLAPVAGRPFLEWVIRYLRRQGIARVVLSAGFQAGQLTGFATEHGLECIAEDRPLGTGGGFVNAVEGMKEKAVEFLVCNGDSLVLAELAPVLDALKDTSVDGVLLGVRVPDASRFGTLEADGRGRLQRFAEKRPGAGLVNGGTYLFRHAAIARFPEKRPLSFEYDVFPALVSQGMKLQVVSCAAPFLDIGTEVSLAQADAFIRGNMRWFE